jgi:hypothetical protein
MKNHFEIFMRKLFIPMAVLLSTLCVCPNVHAQGIEPSTGKLGSTTTNGNGHWVSAQVAISQGSIETAYLAADRACQEGTAIACSFAGELIIQGRVPLATPEQSAGLFKRGCELGNANACQGIGLMLVQGIGITENAQAGKRYMERACEAENSMACTNLGLMHKMGMFGPPNDIQAEAYLKQALDLLPENETATTTLTELQAKNNQKAEGGLSATLRQASILRGRSDTDKPIQNLVAPSQSAIAKPNPVQCERATFDALMGGNNQDLKKPAGHLTPHINVGSNWITSQVELLLAFSEAGQTLAAPNADGAASIVLPNVADCAAAYANFIKAIKDMAWLLASVESHKQIIYGVSGRNEVTAASPSQQKTITFITERQRTADPNEAVSNDLWNNKNLSAYRVNCQTKEATLILSLQFDPRSRLVGSSKTPSLNTAQPQVIIEKHAEMARAIACASPQQAVATAATHSLQAALSLRFEKDQQQTP